MIRALRLIVLLLVALAAAPAPVCAMAMPMTTHAHHPMPHHGEPMDHGCGHVCTGCAAPLRLPAAATPAPAIVAMLPAPVLATRLVGRDTILDPPPPRLRG